MNATRGPLLALHTIFASVVVVSLLAHLSERDHEVAQIRAQALQERNETERLNQEIQQHKALLEGLSRKDPYVVEMLVRDKLQFSRPGEISPPPLPAIDNPPGSGSK